MFLSRENIVLESDNKCIQVGNLFDESEFSTIDICALKTTLLPTIKIPYSCMVKYPMVYEKDGKYYLRNCFIDVKKISESNYLYIPKIKNLESKEQVSKIIAWLYAKYIVSGYIKNSSQIIIPVKRMSSREEKQILNIPDTLTTKRKDGSKVIITENAEIVKLFSNFTRQKSIKNFIIKASQSIYSTFLRSLLVECDEYKRVELESPTLAYQIFMLAYSKTDKILKILEERTGSKKKKSKAKKKFYITYADEDDYDIIGKHLYTKVLQNRTGRNTIGIDISKNRIFDDEVICNSVVVKLIPEAEDDMI